MSDHLLETARQLVQPAKTAAESFGLARQAIASKASQLLAARDDISELIGEKNEAIMNDNCFNFTDFMYSQLRSYSPETFVHTVFWAIRVYRSRGFSVAFWPAELRTFLRVIEEELPEDAFAEIRPFYEWILVNLPSTSEGEEPGE